MRRLITNFNYLKIGEVYKISYFIILNNKKRKIFKFVGLCNKILNKSKSFYLINILNGEKLIILFQFNSPSIYCIEKLENYLYTSRLSTLKKKNNKIFRDSLPNKIKLQTKNKFNTFYFIVDRSSISKGNKIRKLKSKFRL